MSRPLVGIFGFLLIALMIFFGKTMQGPYFTGESITVVNGSKRPLVQYTRTRSALASAEYERKVTLNLPNQIEIIFNLPIDGGAAGDLVVGRGVGRSGQDLIIFEDDLHSFLFDLKSASAYSILRSKDPPLVAQVSEYTGDFPKDMSNSRSIEDLRRSINLGLTTNRPLENICDDRWLYIGTICGPTGDLKLTRKRPHMLPERFMSWSKQTGDTAN